MISEARETAKRQIKICFKMNHTLNYMCAIRKDSFQKRRSKVFEPEIHPMPPYTHCEPGRWVQAECRTDANGAIFSHFFSSLVKCRWIASLFHSKLFSAHTLAISDFWISTESVLLNRYYRLGGRRKRCFWRASDKTHMHTDRLTRILINAG